MTIECLNCIVAARLRLGCPLLEAEAASDADGNFLSVLFANAVEPVRMDFETILVIFAAWLCNIVDALNQLNECTPHSRTACFTYLSYVCETQRARAWPRRPRWCATKPPPPSSLPNNCSSALTFTRTRQDQDTKRTQCGLVYE